MERKFSLYTGASIILALLLTAAIYWPGLDGPFLLDDGVNINDAYVDSASFEDIIYIATHNRSGMLGRPISTFSLALTGFLHGPESWGYKYHNLLIHLLTGLLIFWFLLEIVPLLDRQLQKQKVVMLAAVVALAWLLHPLMVSTVLYAVQRMAQLSALFTVLALLLYVIARQLSLKKIKTYVFLSYFCFPLAMLFAVFSKESGALIPIFILALEFIVFQGISKSEGERKRNQLLLSLMVFLPLILGGVYFATHLSEIANYDGRNFTLIERLYTQLHVVFFYLKLIILPQLGDMSLFHDDFAVTRSFDLSTALLLLFFSGCTVAIYVCRKRAKIISLGIAWFLIGHLMESTVIGLELVFEHRNYLAIVGLLLILFYYLLNSCTRKVSIIVCMIAIGFYSGLTVMRVKVWSDVELLYSIALIDHPGSMRVHNGWANIQYNKGNYDLAIQELEIIYKLDPSDVGALLHEVVLRCGRDKTSVTLLNQVNEELALKPVSAYAISSLNKLISSVLSGTCSQLGPRDIVTLLSSAITQKNNINRPVYFSFLKQLEGQAYMMAGQYEQGVAAFTASYESAKYLKALIELANVQINFRKYLDAEATIAKIEALTKGTWSVEDKALDGLKQKLVRKRLDDNQITK